MATAVQSLTAADGPTINRAPVLLASALLAGGALALAYAVAGRFALLYLIGAALGLTLYHALFGFTSAWRVFLSDRRGAGLRAQMLMLALATALFFPALAAGSLLGHGVGGFVAPLGMSLLVGAAMFGFGMQLGGGCGSGTLYTAGGGNARMLVTLAGFVAGSVLATAHLPWWFAQPSLGAVSLLKALGLGPALALQLALFAAIAAATVLLERHRYGRLLTRPRPAVDGWRRALQGPWPLVAGAIGLALLNFATLAVAGHPWGVTWGLTLWGAKLAQAGGLDVAGWPFWAQGWTNEALLARSVFADDTSVMNFGIMAGALLAAGLAGKFAPDWRIPPRSLCAAVLGGLLMGYGARLAFGCNIGAYFSGIVSGSLHGWVWFVAAMFGSVAGIWARPLFGLEVERTPRGG